MFFDCSLGDCDWITCQPMGCHTTNTTCSTNLPVAKRNWSTIASQSTTELLCQSLCSRLMVSKRNQPHPSPSSPMTSPTIMTSSLSLLKTASWRYQRAPFPSHWCAVAHQGGSQRQACWQTRAWPSPLPIWTSWRPLATVKRESRLC